MQKSLLFAVGTELLLQDNPNATVYFVKLASTGHEQALFVLGMFLEFGIFVQKDIGKAYEYYKRSKTCAGFARIAFLKTHGRPGLLIDSVEGERYKKQALKMKTKNSLDWLNYTADNGLAESLFCLSLDYFNGITGTKQLDLAYEFCLASAERGLSQAQNLLGNMYVEGAGVAKNPSLGLEWYIKAAEQHEPTSIYNIGTLFERGVGVQQSWESAIEWYSRAAMLNSANAHNVLGILHEQAIIDSSTPQQAYYHYKQAALLGHSHAQYNLARCCHDGFGCPVDNAQAFEYFTLAAKQSHQMALLSLAVFYEFAIHVEEDFPKAISLYHLAYQNGSETAKLRLIPIITKQIVEALHLLIVPHQSTKGLFSLPIELRLSIISHLNHNNILDEDEIQDLFNELVSTGDLRVQTRVMEESVRNEIEKSCSCPQKACKKLLHVIVGLKSLEPLL